MKLIKFEQPDCNPCSIVSSYLDSKSISYEKINVLEEPYKASEFGIMGVPVTVLINDHGEEIKRVIGFNPKALDDLIDQLK